MAASRLITTFSLTTLIALALFSASCGKKPPAIVVPPPPDYFQAGEKYFNAADYAQAVQSYDTYLSQYPDASNRDYVLFRLAVAYAFPQSPVRNLPRATQLLRRILQMPSSPYKPQAQLLLGLLDGVDKLRLDVGKRDERIKELTRELERLKQIDMERRPIRPSR